MALDATERAIERLRYEHQDSYSGKKKAYKCKNLLLVALTGHVLFVSPTVEGKMHDKHFKAKGTATGSYTEDRKTGSKRTEECS